MADIHNIQERANGVHTKFYGRRNHEKTFLTCENSKNYYLPKFFSRITNLQVTERE